MTATETAVRTDSQQPFLKGKLSPQIEEVEIHRIRPRSQQPRSFFDEKAIDSLAQSMRRFGQIEAIIVRALPPGGQHDFEIIAGERRYRAQLKNGATTIECRVARIPEEDMAYLVSFGENSAREDMTTQDYARAVLRCAGMEVFTALGDSTKIVRAMAEFIGKSEAFIRVHWRLNDLNPDVFDMLHPDLPKNEQLVVTKAMEIASKVKDKRLHPRIAREIIPMKVAEARVHIERVMAERSADAAETTRNGTSNGTYGSNGRPGPRLGGSSRIAAFLASTRLKIKRVDIVDDDALAAGIKDDRLAIGEAIVTIEECITGLGLLKQRLVRLQAKAK